MSADVIGVSGLATEVSSTDSRSLRLSWPYVCGVVRQEGFPKVISVAVIESPNRKQLEGERAYFPHSSRLQSITAGIQLVTSTALSRRGGRTHA